MVVGEGNKELIIFGFKMQIFGKSIFFPFRQMAELSTLKRKVNKCICVGYIIELRVYLFAGYAYRKWSIKRRGAYIIFYVKGAAFIRERRLFQLPVKHWGECRESWARKRSKKICKPGFKSFPTLKLENSWVGRGLISQAIWFWYIFISTKRRNKGGAFICKYPNQHRGAY